MGIETFESKGLQGREELVQKIKQKAGELEDLMNQIDADEHTTTSNGHIDRPTTRPRSSACKRMTALARTNLEQSIMWAVKAVSRG